MQLTRLQNHPNGPGSTKARGGNIFLPLRQLMAGGMAYETPRATTEAEMMALKALRHVSCGCAAESRRAEGTTGAL